MVTLRFPPGLTPDQCNELLILYALRPISKFLKDPIAAYSTIVTKSSDHKPHAHSLILTKRRQDIMCHAPDIITVLHNQRGTIVDHIDAVGIKPARPDHPAYLHDHVAHQGAETYIYGHHLITHDHRS